MRALRHIFLLVAVLTAASAFAADSDVTVHNKAAGIELGGTLSLPDRGSPRAVLVLASGSGQQNRDEEILGHKPFKRIAESLAERGYAVLRMDDRGIGASGSKFDGAVNADFVSDIRAAVAFTDSLYPGVPKGVLGHSEGGTVAVRTAVADPLCSFIITLAAPAWQGDSIIMSQTRAIATAMTGSWEKEGLQRRLLDIAAGPLPSFMAQSAIIQLLGEDTGAEAAAMPQVQTQFAAAAKVMTSPWYRDMLRYNPAADIAAVDVPWLALNGSLDVQVLPGNLDTIRQLNPKAQTELLPRHNHLFQICTTGLVNEYAAIDHYISDETLNIIADWLDQNISK